MKKGIHVAYVGDHKYNRESEMQRNKRKYVFFSILIGIGMVCSTSCGSGFASNPGNAGTSDMEGAEGGAADAGMAETDAAESGTGENGTAKSDIAEDGTDKSNTAESDMADSGTADAGKNSEAGSGTEEKGTDSAFSEGLPQLPQTAKAFADFVPEGWKILDSVELDFNEDGIPDYVGVLESMTTDDSDDWTYPGDPRILFAVTDDGIGEYRLDFQDINLIRTRGEGGVFGDPYLPLTAEGTSFTTHAYGGSAWRWSEDYTYTYRQGTWLMTSSESTYGYGDYTTSYSKNDWESGIGIRKERSDEFSDMEENWADGEGWDSEKFDLEYELPLDEPVPLELAGKRWWLARDRVTDWEVASMTCAAGVEISEDRVKRPDEAYLSYCDEDCVLYTFSDQESGCYYLAMYHWQDRGLSVLAQEEAAIDGPKIYKEKIYYSTEIVETVKYKTWQDGREQIIEEADTVGVRLNRMTLDGTGKETVFEYRYPEEEQEIREHRIPYLSLIYEINGDEIVAEVYIGSEPHPFYRMKTDGSGAKKIGQV